jgi:hypothetical protein
MNALATAFCLSSVLILAAPGAGVRAGEADDLRARIEPLVRPLLDKKQAVGVVVGVIEGGWKQVFGFGREALDGDKTPDG